MKLHDVVPGALTACQFHVDLADLYVGTAVDLPAHRMSATVPLRHPLHRSQPRS